MIQLYHIMDTLVTRIWRALTAPRNSVPVPPGGVRVLPAYAALARYHMSSIELDGRLRMFVTQLAAERSHCRWCIERGRHLWREAQLPVDALHALLRHGGMPLDPLMRARQHLSEPEIAAVTALVAAQHFFNPITGALGADVAPWGPPVGSSVRNLWL